jgi:hypothetical protein
VDWRKAHALYEATIGRNPRAKLACRTFREGNHNISVSATGSVREVEGMPGNAGVKCEEYYDARIEWLRTHVLSQWRAVVKRFRTRGSISIDDSIGRINLRLGSTFTVVCKCLADAQTP